MTAIKNRLLFPDYRFKEVFMFKYAVSEYCADVQLFHPGTCKSYDCVLSHRTCRNACVSLVVIR